MVDNQIQVTELPNFGEGDRFKLELNFHRFVYDRTLVSEKRIELIRDVIAWLHGLQGDDAAVRDSFIRGIGGIDGRANVGAERN